MATAAEKLPVGVTSHPELNNAGATSFYGELPDGAWGVSLLRGGRLQTGHFYGLNSRRRWSPYRSF